VFSHNGFFYLLDPATRSYASMNESAYALVTNPENQASLSALSGEKRKDLAAAVTHLRKLGILATSEEMDRNGTAPFPEDSATMTRLIIFLTNKCNLRCLYCYARGGDSEISIKEDVWRPAMDYFFATLKTAKNYEAVKKGGVDLNIHGGGEPTVEFSLMKEIIGEFYKRSREEGLHATVVIGTNGTYDKAVFQWIVKNNINVNISLDGPRDIHNRLRPLRSGQPSYDRIIRNLKALVKSGRRVSIRATVTSESVSSMEDTIELARRLGLAVVHFETVTLTGRASCGTVLRPDAEQFIENFLKCFTLGLKLDIDVRYSGMHCFGIYHRRFCSACGQNFCVTPEGNITTCYEVLDTNDPAADLFFVGKVDVSQQRVILDETRIHALRKRTSDNMKACSDCFLKYQCAGDCLAKSYRSTGDIYSPDPYRCYIAKRINKTLITWLTDGVIEPRDAGKVMDFSLNMNPI
jgi:uncharacterized protein